MRFGVFALGLALLTGATGTVNQGAPGHQGPWPVFIATLPDGGGGMQMVPCPFTVTEPDGGIAEFVDCDGSINWNQFNPAILWGVDPTGVGLFNGVTTIVSLPDGGTLHGQVTGGTFQTDTASESTPGYAFRSAGGLKWQLDDSDSNNYTHSGGVHPGTYNNEWYTSDAGYCFHDGTCQTSAAGTGFLDDAGNGDGSIVNNNGIGITNRERGIVLVGSSTEVTGIGQDSQFQVVTYCPASNPSCSFPRYGFVVAREIGGGTLNQIAFDFNGGSPGITSNTSFDLEGAGTAYLRIDTGNVDVRLFVPVDMVSSKIKNLAPGTVSTDAANFSQTQETVALSGATMPGLSPSNNLVIGSMKSNTGNGQSLTRSSVSITCLVSGVGAGNTAVNLNDATDTAGNPQVSVPEACACAVGAVTNASVTGLAKADTDQFDLALKSTAATDCATYPLFIVSGQVTLK